MKGRRANRVSKEYRERKASVESKGRKGLKVTPG